MSAITELEEFHKRVDAVHAQFRQELERLLKSHDGEEIDGQPNQRRFASLANRALDRVDARLAIHGDDSSYRLHVRRTSSGRGGFQFQRPDGGSHLGFSAIRAEGLHVIERPMTLRELKSSR